MKIDNYFIRMLSILRLKSIFSVIVLLLLLSGNIFAQQKVFKTQGIPRPEQKIQNDNKSQSQKVKESSTRDNTFTFNNIEFWVGEGENRAALIVDWYDDGETAMVWGFRWNGYDKGYCESRPKISIAYTAYKSGQYYCWIGLLLLTTRYQHHL